MVGWAVVFLAIALIGALFGFTGVAAASTQVAQVIFFVFITLFVIAVVLRLLRRPPV